MVVVCHLSSFSINQLLDEVEKARNGLIKLVGSLMFANDLLGLTANAER